MDEPIKKLMTIGVPGLLLWLSMMASGKTGDAGIWTGLANIGVIYGPKGGLLVLLMVGLVSNAFSQVAVDGLLVSFYQKRRQSEPSEQLVGEIDRLPFSQDLKMKLKWAVLHHYTILPPDLIPWGFIVATVLLVVLSLTGYLGEFHYLLDLTAHFKLQYLLAGFCLFFFFLLTKRKVWCIVSIFCILLNLIEVMPWYLPQIADATNPNSQPLRVLQSNVLFRNKQSAAVISMVRAENPDIAVFQEVGPFWNKELKALRDTFPYSLVPPDPEGFEPAIYSKLPLENTSIIVWDGTLQFIYAEFKVEDKIVSIIGIHTSSPTDKRDFNQRNQQLAFLGDYLAKIKNPVLVVGDFNITMWSPIYKQFIQKVGLKNTRSGFGILPTWSTKLPPLSIPIDHCLVSPNVKVLQMRASRYVGSDHLPLITDLVIGNQ
ncbi:MAG TPA: endonuclease/exonuclease/phosphatase [Cyanobacteria bacterium UBA11372]|nr:endonuclease/exonuclease/phosphatase [Cyanobacteria bacterium UBA11372]